MEPSFLVNLIMRQTATGPRLHFTPQEPLPRPSTHHSHRPPMALLCWPAGEAAPEAQGAEQVAELPCHFQAGSRGWPSSLSGFCSVPSFQGSQAQPEAELKTAVPHYRSFIAGERSHLRPTLHTGPAVPFFFCYLLC